MPRAHRALNRATLALAGLVFLAGGIWLAVTGAVWAPSLPQWWPTVGHRTAIVDPEELTAARTHGWWTPAIMAGSTAATVLLTLWCARQLRSGFRPLVALPAPGSTLRAGALQDAVTQHAVAIGGVARCHTRVLARPRDLHVRLHVWLEPDVTPTAVLPALTELATQTQMSLNTYRVRTRVRLSTRSHRRSHVR